jgi:hypothetical protein
LSNRFQPLYNLSSDEPTGRTQTERKALSRNKTLLLKRTKRKRILIVGDSHVKGMASEIQHKLADDYVVQEIVKSGADMEVILDSNVKEARNLAKDDFLIIW